MRFSQLCWWICQPCKLPYAYHQRSLFSLSSGQFKKSIVLGLPWSWVLQAPPKQSYLHTKLPCNLYQKKMQLCVCLVVPELIQGSIRRMLWFMLHYLTFSYQLLHKDIKSPKKNSNRAIQEGPKLVDTYVASLYPPLCKTICVFSTKAPIAFPSCNLLVWIVKWDSYVSVKIVNIYSTILTANQEQNSILQCIK